MDATVVTAIIGALATIITAIIGSIVNRSKEKKNVELKKDLVGYLSGEKQLRHYLLFWWRGENDWAEKDWLAACEYVGKFQPTCGFSQLEAAKAEFVTIVGAPSGVSDGAEKFLKEANCKIERLDGKTFDDTAALFNHRIRANKAFEGGLHRLGY